MNSEIPQVTYAVIGTQHGHLTELIRQLRNRPNTVCAGVYDDEISSAKKISDQFDLPLVDDSRRLLDSSAVSLVVSAAVNGDKGAILTSAIKAGKSVIVDKPLVTSLAQLTDLENATNEHGGHIGLMLSERYAWYGRRLKKLCDDGDLGKISSIMSWRPHRLARESRPDWMFEYERYGGIIVDLLIHDLDICRWITGSEFEEVTAYEQNVDNPDDPDFVDAGMVMGRLADGTVTMSRTDWLTSDSVPVHGDSRFLVSGTEGTAEVLTAGDIFAKPEKSTPPQIKFVSNSKPPQLLKVSEPGPPILGDMLSSIYEGKQPVVTTYDAIESTRATLMAQQSARQDGKTVKRGIDGQ